MQTSFVPSKRLILLRPGSRYCHTVKRHLLFSPDISSCKLNIVVVLHPKLGNIIAVDQDHCKGLNQLLIKGDSQLVVHASKYHANVPCYHRKQWNNCLCLNMYLLFSHVYRAGNTYVDKLAALWHIYLCFTGWHIFLGTFVISLILIFLSFILILLFLFLVKGIVSMYLYIFVS